MLPIMMTALLGQELAVGQTLITVMTVFGEKISILRRFSQTGKTQFLALINQILRYTGYASYSVEDCPSAEWESLYLFNSECVIDDYDACYVTGACYADDAYTQVSYFFCDEATCPISDSKSCVENPIARVYGSGCYSNGGQSYETFCNITSDS